MSMADLGRTYQETYIWSTEAISGLGANITDESIQRIGKCLGRVKSTMHQFDLVNNVAQESGHHTSHSTDVDLKKIVKQLRLVSVCPPTWPLSPYISQAESQHY